MNAIRLTCFTLVITAFLGDGCGTPKPAPNPLEGWHVRRPSFALPKDKVIEDDYNVYIQALPPEERQYVDKNSVWFLEDSTGQTAVQIKIPLHGTWWIHALIYDKDNKRIKTVKYKAGQYRS